MIMSKLHSLTLACGLLLAMGACVDQNKSNDSENTSAKVEETQQVADPFSPKSKAGPMSHEDSLFIADIPDKPWEDNVQVGTVDGKVVMLQCRDREIIDYKEENGNFDLTSRAIDYPQWRLVTIQNGKILDSCYYRGHELLENVSIKDNRVLIKHLEQPYEYEVTDMPRYIDAYANRFADYFVTDSLVRHSSTDVSDSYGDGTVLIIHPKNDDKLLAQTIAWLCKFMPFNGPSLSFKNMKKPDGVKEFIDTWTNVVINEEGSADLTVVPVWRSADGRFETYRLGYQFSYVAAGPKYLRDQRYLTLDNQEGIMLGYKDVFNDEGTAKFGAKCQSQDKDIPEVALLPNGLMVMGELVPQDHAVKILKEPYKSVWKK